MVSCWFGVVNLSELTLSLKLKKHQDIVLLGLFTVYLLLVPLSPKKSDILADAVTACVASLPEDVAHQIKVKRYYFLDLNFECRLPWLSNLHLSIKSYKFLQKPTRLMSRKL
jgi:hypothetical protein